MASKAVDVDPDITDSDCEETPTGPEVSSAVTQNESDAHSVLETSLEHTQPQLMSLNLQLKNWLLGRDLKWRNQNIRPALTVVRISTFTILF